MAFDSIGSDNYIWRSQRASFSTLSNITIITPSNLIYKLQEYFVNRIISYTYERKFMQRRQIISMVCSSTVVTIPGCSIVSSNNGDPQTPEGMSVSTRNWVGAFISHGQKEPFAIVAATATDAIDSLAKRRSNREKDDPIEFVEQTDFDDSHLLMIRWCCAPSDASIECSRIERRDTGVHVEAEVTEPNQEGPADMSTHNLFIRVTDEQGNTPEKASVDVEKTESDRWFSH
jgi:hypothetical protein